MTRLKFNTYSGGILQNVRATVKEDSFTMYSMCGLQCGPLYEKPASCIDGQQRGGSACSFMKRASS